MKSIENLEEIILTTCRFCNPPEKERILYETSNFYVMLSLGPIVEGYLLLVSKEHINSCIEIPANVASEFDKLYDLIKELLAKQYGNCISYEHGRAGSCLIPIEGSKHCYHAHMHFVPINTKLNQLVDADWDGIQINSLEDFRKRNEPSLSYLFVDDGIKMLYPIHQPLRRQYLRYKTATSIGKADLWNWVTHQGWNLIESGYKKLKPVFDNIEL